MVYNREEVYKKTLEYFNGDELAANVFINKYAMKDSAGNIYEQSPDDMHRRIASEIARVEAKYPNPVSEEVFYEAMRNFKHIVPQGGSMTGIGNEHQVVSLSNCFVIGSKEDSYGSIFMTDEQQVQLMKRRGGVGHDLSHIRPSKSPVKNSAITSTGIVPFMERYSNSTREVGQDGRRGALMLSCFHPSTFVLVESGWTQIRNVIDRLSKGEVVRAWTHEGFRDITDYQVFDDRDVYEVTAENNKTIIVTPDHEFMVVNTLTNEEYLKAIGEVSKDVEELVFYHGDVKSYSRIKNYVHIGKSTVMDFTVDQTHRILANNFYTSNCSIKHPNSEDFMDAKMEQGKVTGANISLKIDDEFMHSAINDTDYVQKYPVDSDTPMYTNTIKAKNLFGKLIHNAWKSAEPGCLFWDTVIRESVADCYADLGFETISTNPCVVGDTLVSVADGRTAVTIKQLAEEGKDVPVFSLTKDNELVVRTMRNPRVTGYQQKIFKVTIEGGIEYRVTGNHKFVLNNGTEKQAKDLKYGDSLKIMTRSEEQNYAKTNNYVYLIINNRRHSEHRLIGGFYNNVDLMNGSELVIHHKDHNGLNNNYTNLELLTKKDHDRIHGDEMLGENNPYHKFTDEQKFDLASHPGKSNPRYCGVDNAELLEIGIRITKEAGHRLSRKEWQVYAKANNLPLLFTEFRIAELGDTVTFLKNCAIKAGLKYVDEDPRLVKNLNNMIEQGYNAKIENKVVYVERTCEHCGEKFWTTSNHREVSFCNMTCANFYLNKNTDVNVRRTESLNSTYSDKMDDIKFKQLDVYTELRQALGRIPKLEEWEALCTEKGISHRLNTKYGFKNFVELKEAAIYHNHRVVSVVEDGVEDVYNGTVDETHRYFITDKDMVINTLTLNCGELPLPARDSCRLIATNLYSYVVNPFTSEAYFDFDLFKEHSFLMQRMMDDIIDLELEKIDAILAKIDSDPETSRTKQTEYELWSGIKDTCTRGRRMGVGITAEGDMIAAMGLRYGTKEATDFSVTVQKALAVNVYKSSCLMAKERGSFPVFDASREVNNPMIARLSEADPELAELLKLGRRNIALLTIAPTGSVSIMTQTTSGIEPAFQIAYRRRKKINPNDKNSRVDFVDEKGDSWEEYGVFHHKFITWLTANGFDYDEVKNYSQDKLDDLIKLSPYHKSTSNDVDWVEKVRMQGAIQKWVDHSISVTVNLPENTTEDVVSEIYKTAWSSGCKGITIYRDGCRSGVLISNNDKSDKKPAKSVDQIIKENNAHKRPSKIECEILRFNNNKEKWVGFVGLLDGSPYEIFTGILDNFQVPTFVEKGWIVKVKDDGGSSRYDLIYMDKDGYEQEMRGLSRAFNREYWNYAKLISGVLRHRMPIPNVINLIDTLDLGGDNITSWKSGVKRMLKKFITEHVKAEGEICPSCGGTNVVRTGGCTQCLEPGCGWSKCS